MTTGNVVQVKRDGSVRRLNPFASLMASVRREEMTPYRLRCVLCHKILGEVGEDSLATLCCPKCRRLTMGAVKDGRMVLVDMGRAHWGGEEEPAQIVSEEAGTHLVGEPAAGRK